MKLVKRVKIPSGRLLVAINYPFTTISLMFMGFSNCELLYQHWNGFLTGQQPSCVGFITAKKLHMGQNLLA
jgi:hypothetical protein